MRFIKANTLVCALDSCQNFVKLYKQKLKKQSEHPPRDAAPNSIPCCILKGKTVLVLFFFFSPLFLFLNISWSQQIKVGDEGIRGTRSTGRQWAMMFLGSLLFSLWEKKKSEGSACQGVTAFPLKGQGQASLQDLRQPETTQPFCRVAKTNWAHIPPWKTSREE